MRGRGRRENRGSGAHEADCWWTAGADGWTGYTRPPLLSPTPAAGGGPPGRHGGRPDEASPRRPASLPEPLGLAHRPRAHTTRRPDRARAGEAAGARAWARRRA